jgi:hypothetical protein
VDQITAGPVRADTGSGESKGSPWVRRIQVASAIALAIYFGGGLLGLWSVHISGG